MDLLRAGERVLLVAPVHLGGDPAGEAAGREDMPVEIAHAGTSPSIATRSMTRRFGK